MHGVRQRDIDGLNFGIVEQVLIRAMTTLDAVVSRPGGSSSTVSAPDRDELDKLGSGAAF
jgi:hypothetical protein